MKTKGFTLIELLVVIAIIGILASVVLAALNTSREKAKDKAIMSDLANVRTEIELYVSTNGTTGAIYSFWCPDTNIVSGVYGTQKVKDILRHANIQAGGSGVAPVFNRLGCYNGGTNWAVIAILNENNGKTAWCVDASGKSKKYSLATAYVITTTEVDTANYLCR